MTLDTITQEIERLSDADYTALLTWQAETENPRRDRKRVTEESNTALITELREAGELPAPEAVDIKDIEATDDIPEW